MVRCRNQREAAQGTIFGSNRASTQLPDRLASGITRADLRLIVGEAGDTLAALRRTARVHLVARIVPCQLAHDHGRSSRHVGEDSAARTCPGRSEITRLRRSRNHPELQPDTLRVQARLPTRRRRSVAVGGALHPHLQIGRGWKNHIVAIGTAPRQQIVESQARVFVGPVSRRPVCSRGRRCRPSAPGTARAVPRKQAL